MAATLLLIAALLLIAPAEASPAAVDPGSPGRPAPGGEAWKGIWIKADELATDGRIRDAVRNAAAWGATDLLVQVRVRGDALYLSSHVPPSSSLSRDAGLAAEVLTRDPLRLVLEEAHARGLRVHAWFNCFVAWSGMDDPPAGHALADHPDWALRLTDGRSTLGLSPAARRKLHLEGAYLDPGSVEVRRHLLTLVDELVRAYPLDGLHWDYVRYPHAHCVDPAPDEPAVVTDPTILSASTLATGPARATGAVPPDDSPGVSESTRAQHRREAVSAFVAEAAGVARSIRPGIVLSAAVRPDPEEARYAVDQDWITWLDRGWIDRAVLMAYTASPYRLADYRRRELLAGADSLRLVCGLGTYLFRGNDLRGQLEQAGERFPAGVCLFAYDHVVGEPERARIVQTVWGRHVGPTRG